MMSAFCASVNFGAFMRSRSSTSQGFDAETSAMTRIMGRARHKIPTESWIGQKLANKPKMLVGIALANRMARQIWAMLTKNEDYRDPALVAA
jgi:hypothetical protein